LGAQIDKHGVNPFLIDDTHTVRGDAQADKTLFAFNPKPMDMQIRQKPAPGFIGMRNIISSDRTLTRHLANSGHRIISNYSTNL
jgi:hypothetical protein